MSNDKVGTKDSGSIVVVKRMIIVIPFRSKLRIRSSNRQFSRLPTACPGDAVAGAHTVIGNTKMELPCFPFPHVLMNHAVLTSLFEVSGQKAARRLTAYMQCTAVISVIL